MGESSDIFSLHGWLSTSKKTFFLTKISSKRHVFLWLMKLLRLYSPADRMDETFNNNFDFKEDHTVMITCFLVHIKQKSKERQDRPEPRSESDDKGQETRSVCDTMMETHDTSIQSISHTAVWMNQQWGPVAMQQQGHSEPQLPRLPQPSP